VQGGPYRRGRTSLYLIFVFSSLHTYRNLYEHCHFIKKKIFCNYENIYLMWVQLFMKAAYFKPPTESET